MFEHPGFLFVNLYQNVLDCTTKNTGENSDVPIPLSEFKLRKELSEAARKAGLDVNRVLSAFGFEDEEEGVAKDF